MIYIAKRLVQYLKNGWLNFSNSSSGRFHRVCGNMLTNSSSVNVSYSWWIVWMQNITGNEPMADTSSSTENQPATKWLCKACRQTGHDSRSCLVVLDNYYLDFGCSGIFYLTSLRFVIIVLSCTQWTVILLPRAYTESLIIQLRDLPLPSATSNWRHPESNLVQN
jgi:hypothetical protein